MSGKVVWGGINNVVKVRPRNRHSLIDESQYSDHKKLGVGQATSQIRLGYHLSFDIKVGDYDN